MIVYTSRTGNVRSIVNKLNIECIELQAGMKVNKPFVIFTYTDGLGQAPKKVLDFLEDNNYYLRGIIVSGNTNFGINNFCGAGNAIYNLYKKPILLKIEMRGNVDTPTIIERKYNEIMLNNE